MADKSTTAQFGIELVDGMSTPAENAAKALENLKKEIEGDSKALSEMQKAMRQLKAATTGDVAKPMADLQVQMDTLKNKIAKSRGEFVNAGGSFSQLKAKTTSLKTSFKEQQAVTLSLSQKMEAFSKQISNMPGPLSSMVQGLSKVVGTMSSATLAAGALIAAFVAVAAGAAIATKALFSEALASGDAARNELLHFEALTKMRNLLGIAPGKAKDMQDAVDKVSASVSISREKVAGFAEQLYRAGARGPVLANALEGASIKASALGDAAGSAFAGWAGSMALAGGSVKRLSDDVKNRFGGVVQKQMSSLAVQTLKQKENFASLFRGINVEPFLDAMKRLRDIFSVNTAAGQALKQMFTIFLQPLFGAAEGGAVVMRRFFKQMIIGVQELVIAFLIVRNWFRKTFGPDQNELLGKFFGRVKWGRVFVYLLAAAVTALAVAFVAMTWPVLGFLIIMAGLFEAVESIIESWDDLMLAFDQMDWGELGTNIIKGILGGLIPGGAQIADALTDVAKQGYAAFKQALDIQSPSKVFAKLGTEIPAGAAEGIEAGSPEAQRAAANMVDATSIQLGNSAQQRAAAQPATAGAPAATGGNVTLTIGELHVHAESSEPKSLAVALRREVEAIFEGVGLQLGAQPLGVE